MSDATPRALSRPILVAYAVVAMACSHTPSTTHATPQSANGDVAGSNYWVAVLGPTSSLASPTQGRADISLNPSTQSASVLLFLTGLQPNQTYIWHIRRGTCSVTEPAGPASEYAPLTVDAHGRGTATGTFPITDPALNNYHIDVHPAGPEGRPSAVPQVACGELIARHA
jgi:hypothetical protein